MDEPKIEPTNEELKAELHHLRDQIGSLQREKEREQSRQIIRRMQVEQRQYAQSSDSLVRSNSGKIMTLAYLLWLLYRTVRDSQILSRELCRFWTDNFNDCGMVSILVCEHFNRRYNFGRTHLVANIRPLLDLW